VALDTQRQMEKRMVEENECRVVQSEAAAAHKSSTEAGLTTIKVRNSCFHWDEYF
jgi:hypothetical protein